jgi:hypothetical protein
MAHVPSHHDHTIGEWIGIRAEVDHVVTFNRACPVQDPTRCQNLGTPALEASVRTAENDSLNLSAR